MAFWLEIHHAGTVERKPLAASEVTIGRGADTDIAVEDRRASRRHCRIQETPQGLLLEDLESRNGTQLNGYAVKKSFIKAGDEFRVGSFRFVVCSGEPPATEEPAGPGAGAGETTPPAEAPRASATPRAAVSQEVAAAPPTVADSPGTEAGAAPAKGAAAYLEGLQGPHAGTRIAIEQTPFVVGRGKDCDFRLRDPKASTHHLRVTAQGSVYRVEDLGSTNGTLLNKRPMERAVLMPGMVLQIGSCAFRVHVPRARPPPAGTGDAAPAEDFVEFDVEKFLAQDRTQHPLTVVALVLMLVVLGYFAVDIALKVVRRVALDPAAEGNLVGMNWSFERQAARDAEAGAGAGAAVAGWRLRSWPERAGAAQERGSIAVTGDHAQLPGRLALRVAGQDPAGACLASHDVKLGIRGGGTYRLEGHIYNESAMAAGIVVEWVRDGGGDAAVCGQTWSETARAAQEAADADRLVTAPAAASSAVISACVLGAGSAVFDRISLSETTADAAARELPSFPVGAAAPGKSLTLVAEPDGTFSVRRARRRPLVTALWAGLPPGSDPFCLGPRLASSEAVAREPGSLLFLADVPDQARNSWLAVETKTTSHRGDVSIRWRAASTPQAAQDASGAGLSLYIEMQGASTPVELHDGSGNRLAEGGEALEIVIGTGDDQISLTLSAPLKVRSGPHPLNPGARLWIGQGRLSSLEVTVSRGSRYEALAASEAIRKAEEDFRSAKVSAAYDSLMRFAERFPDQKAAIARARAILNEWRKRAADEVARLGVEFQELRKEPVAVLYASLLSRARALSGRYRGTSHGAAAQQILEKVEKFWEARKREKKLAGLRTLYEAGTRYFALDSLALAELYLGWVAAEAPEGQMRSDAENKLKIIEGRRQRNVNLFLK